MNAHSCFSFRRSGSAALLLGVAGPLWAQTVVAPSNPSVAAHAPFSGPSFMSPAGGPLKSLLGTQLPLFRRGPLTVRPHFLYRATRATGMEAAPGISLDTTTQTISPGAAVDLGDHWNADYTATWTYYTNKRFHDSFDQEADLSGMYGYADWAVHAFGTYAITHSVLVESARQTKETKASGGAGFACNLGQKTELEIDASQSYRRADAVTSTADWVPMGIHETTASAALQYALTARTAVSGGLTLRYARQSTGLDMNSYRPEVRVVWTPIDSLSIMAGAGDERTHFRGKHGRDTSNPTFQGEVRYKPAANTTMYANYSRSIATTYVASSVVKSDGWQAGIDQRLFDLLDASAAYSRQRSRYLAAMEDLQTERSDRVTTIDARLSMAVLSRGSVAVFWNRTRNASSLAGYTFTTTQIGAEISFRF